MTHGHHHHIIATHFFFLFLFSFFSTLSMRHPYPDITYASHHLLHSPPNVGVEDVHASTPLASRT